MWSEKIKTSRVSSRALIAKSSVEPALSSVSALVELAAASSASLSFSWFAELLLWGIIVVVLGLFAELVFAEETNIFVLCLVHGDNSAFLNIGVFLVFLHVFLVFC